MILFKSFAVTVGDGEIVKLDVAAAVGILTVAEARGVVEFSAFTTIFCAPQPPFGEVLSF